VQEVTAEKPGELKLLVQVLHKAVQQTKADRVLLQTEGHLLIVLLQEINHTVHLLETIQNLVTVGITEVRDQGLQTDHIVHLQGITEAIPARHKTGQIAHVEVIRPPVILVQINHTPQVQEVRDPKVQVLQEVHHHQEGDKFIKY
jgi:hypothetical protein